MRLRLGSPGRDALANRGSSRTDDAPPRRHAGVTALLVYYGAHVLAQPLSVAVPLAGRDTFVSLTQVVIAGTLLTMLRWLPQGLGSRHFNRIAGPLVVFLCVTMASAVWSGRGALTVLTLAANTCWFLVVGAAMSKPMPFAEARRLLQWLLYLSLIPAVAGAIEVVMRRPLFTYGVMAQGISQGVFYLRGTHTDKLDFASDMAVLTFSALALSVVHPNRRRRKLLLICIVIGVVLAVFSWSTTGIIGLGLGGLGTAIALSERHSFFRLFAVVVVSTVAVGLLWVPTEVGSYQREATMLKYEREVEQADLIGFRWRSMRGCIDGFMEKPLFGHGLGSQFDHTQAATEGRRPISAHTMLSIALELGVLGAIPFVLLWHSALAAVLPGGQKRTLPLHSSRLLLPVSFGILCFQLPRFLFYFHYLDESIYFIALALAVAVGASRGPLGRRQAARNRGRRTGKDNGGENDRAAAGPLLGPPTSARPSVWLS